MLLYVSVGDLLAERDDVIDSERVGPRVSDSERTRDRVPLGDEEVVAVSDGETLSVLVDVLVRDDVCESVADVVTEESDFDRVDSSVAVVECDTVCEFEAEFVHDIVAVWECDFEGEIDSVVECVCNADVDVDSDDEAVRVGVSLPIDPTTEARRSSDPHSFVQQCFMTACLHPSSNFLHSERITEPFSIFNYPFSDLDVF